jgi:hypothetical protein
MASAGTAAGAVNGSMIVDGDFSREYMRSYPHALPRTHHHTSKPIAVSMIPHDDMDQDMDLYFPCRNVSLLP